MACQKIHGSWVLVKYHLFMTNRALPSHGLQWRESYLISGAPSTSDYQNPLWLNNNFFCKGDSRFPGRALLTWIREAFPSPWSLTLWRMLLLFPSNNNKKEQKCVLYDSSTFRIWHNRIHSRMWIKVAFINLFPYLQIGDRNSNIIGIFGGWTATIPSAYWKAMDGCYS